MNSKENPNNTDQTTAFDLTDEDVIAAMKEIEGYLDISVRDFRELYVHAIKLARRRFLRATPVKAIMQSKVIAIGTDANFEEIIAALAENAVSGLPVIDANNCPVGVVSEKDIFNKLSGKKGSSFWEVLSGCLHHNGCLMQSIASLTASDIMTTPAITIEEFASVRDAIELYKRRNINRVPITDSAGKLVGIVTRTDILNAHLEFEEE